MFARHDTRFRCDRFISGERDIDSWFRKKSLKDHMALRHIVTCAYFARAPDDPIGFYAFATVVEEASRLPGTGYRPFFGNGRYFPCLNLIYVAVQQTLQGQGNGTAIMGRVIAEFADIGEATGLPLMILTPADARAVAFYKRLGFDSYRRGAGMYLPLQSAIEARDLTA